MKKLILTFSLSALVFFCSNKIHAQNNPMGNTWVVFIENSNYQSFKKLESPSKDVTTIKNALGSYQITNIIYKKDLTKLQMDRFFNTELRDMLISNQVKSLMIWYAGHGKYINNIGYWLPSDSKPDVESSYFSVNAFKVDLLSYKSLAHILVVSNASEAGPSFFKAMRSAPPVPSCDSLREAAYKSYQIFSSAGNEPAADNSQFADAFSNGLIGNTKSCLPIESLVISVFSSFSKSNIQRPRLGIIDGLPNENGTFFFIKK